MLKMQDMPEEMLDEFDREVDLMNKLRHKNIGKRHSFARYSSDTNSSISSIHRSIESCWSLCFDYGIRSKWQCFSGKNLQV
jgi:hypothetical protein